MTTATAPRKTKARTRKAPPADSVVQNSAPQTDADEPAKHPAIATADWIRALGPIAFDIIRAAVAERAREEQSNEGSASEAPPASGQVSAPASPASEADKFKHVRPGLIVADMNTGSGISLVLKVMEDGKILMLNATGDFWDHYPENFSESDNEIPEPGSIFDRIADEVAKLFPRFEETQPFALQAVAPLPLPPVSSSSKSKLRPGLIVYDDSQDAVGVVLRSGMPEGLCLILSSTGAILHQNESNFSEKHLPAPGSPLDALANHIAALFPLIGESGPRQDRPEGWMEFMPHLHNLRKALHEAGGRWWGNNEDLAGQATDIDGKLEQVEQDLKDLAKSSREHVGRKVKAGEEPSLR
jgi:hypothetical protein